MRRQDRVAILCLIGLCYAIMAWRIHARMYTGGREQGQVRMELVMNMAWKGHGDDVKVKVFMPSDNERQQIRNERLEMADYKVQTEKVGLNKIGTWEKADTVAAVKLGYSCEVECKERRYEIAKDLVKPASHPKEVERFLMPAELIQSDSPEIVGLYKKLVPAGDRDKVHAILTAIYHYTSDVVSSAKFKGETDALTCLRLGEAACGGKTRLFVALCRAAGIPARPVGGLILKQGKWRPSHLWAEAWVEGQWIPFCPLNHHWAKVPADYLLVYYDEQSLFTHSRDINFQYEFRGKPLAATTSPWQSFGLQSAIEAPIPVDLLKVILMIPVGALVVVFARNMIGMDSFGTFMPALLAAAFVQTGLSWGVGLFGAILAIGYVFRSFLNRFQLLQSPKLGMMMTGTVLLVMAITTYGVIDGFEEMVGARLFPVIILTLTVERFAILEEENGLRQAVQVVLGTVLIVAAAYGTMISPGLRNVVFTFPETLLLVMAMFFIVGRWRGMRLIEYLRFRKLLLHGSHNVASVVTADLPSPGVDSEHQRPQPGPGA